MHVLVTSAYGNQGRLLVPKLLAAGAEVRALDIADAAREGLRKLGAQDVVIADMTEPAVVARAVADVDAVYHIGPNAHAREREIGLLMIDAAMAAGVKHFVYSSVLHPNISALQQHLFKRDVEERLTESGLAYTILQPAHYMQTLQYRHAFDTGAFHLTWSLERRQALIDVDDITTVAAKVVKEGQRHFYATYELSSDECVTAHEIAAAIRDVIGQPVDVHEVLPEEVISTLFPHSDAALFAERVRLFRKVAAWYSTHDFMGNSATLQSLLGRAPTKLRDFLKREYDRHAKPH